MRQLLALLLMAAALTRRSTPRRCMAARGRPVVLERQGQTVGQRFVSYQVAQASRLSRMRFAHSGELADAQPASA